MRSKFVETRAKVSFQYRKQQDRLVGTILESLCEKPIAWKPIHIAELNQNIARLERARDLMTKELASLLQNHPNVKVTDVEIISQSIRNGVVLL